MTLKRLVGVFESAHRLDARLKTFFSQPLVAFNALLIVVLAAHGYEIFNLHLTIDEEIHLNQRSVVMDWIAQGRWGMALVSMVLPSSVAPTVSTALGIGLLATSLWLLFVRLFGADRYTAVCAVGVAIGMPVLAFTMSFTTLAYGIGFASLATVGFIVLLRHADVASLCGAAILGAFAISVYQPMLFALAALVVSELCRPEASTSFKSRLRGVWLLLVAVAVYFTVDQVARRLLRAEMQYVDQFIDLKGLLTHPWERIDRAAHNAFRVLRNSERFFALHSQALWIFLLAAIAASAIPSGTGRLGRHARLITVVLLLTIPIAAEALTAHGVPLRSGVYFPFVVGLIAISALRSTGAAWRLFLAGLALFAVLGNTVVSNRLYAAAAFAYERDRLLAHDIIREVTKLTADPATQQNLSMEVVGVKSWPESKLIPLKETLGATFFQWDGGNRYRVAYLLTTLGLNVHAASDEERLPHIGIALRMPSWPMDGWVRREGTLIIVKLGEYTNVQRQALCVAGIVDLCRPGSLN